MRTGVPDTCRQLTISPGGAILTGLAEMSSLCAELEQGRESLTSAERESLSHRAECLCSELDNNYGVPAFRPEVPEATVKMFSTLAKLVFED